MINITIKKDFKSILISGHAGYDKFGKDIVCASVSSIAITTINACLSIDDTSLCYTENDGLLMIKIENDSPIIKKLIINMLNLLNELAIDYPKNIKIKNEG